ncbi:uncharacterized protein LOC143476339 isoform X1 [Brachyhypopomus gauderio]|uniref:uncharacterized protein LOC143476339 isoform X1 n=1 Tax=Brachyhypopomus gauderio TaxID=698409 RepID=UPI0040413401
MTSETTYRLPLNVYVIILGIGLFILMLSMIFCCYLFSLRRQGTREQYGYTEVVLKGTGKKLSLLGPGQLLQKSAKVFLLLFGLGFVCPHAADLCSLPRGVPEQGGARRVSVLTRFPQKVLGEVARDPKGLPHV